MPDLTTVELLDDLQAVLDGTGRHADHERTLAGRCVQCSCGTRARFQGAPPADLVAAASGPAARTRRWQVRLADGFVCLVTDRKSHAAEVAAKHDGATVEPVVVEPVVVEPAA